MSNIEFEVVNTMWRLTPKFW